MLHEDLEMRRVILARLRNAGIAKIETERSSNAQLTVTIHTAKPGIVIGKGGSSVDQLREDLEKRFGNRVRISIQEIKQPELDAQLVVGSPEAAVKVAPRRTRTATAKVEEKTAAPARPKAAPKPKAEAKTEVKKTAVRTKSTPAAVKKTGTTRNTKKADS